MAVFGKTKATPQQVKGCCPLDCQDTCSWVVTVRDGVAERIGGAREHPFTRGGLCAKVKDYPTRTYSSDRLLQPLRRDGPKGSGLFRPIGWEEALTTIARRFHEIISEHGSEALMPIHYLGSMGVVQRLALMRVFNALGASRIHGDMCGAAGFALMEQGHSIGFDWEHVIDSELIVLWGANLLTTCHHHWHFVKGARKNGAKVISIDPRVTRTARHSDQHISIRPGTDSVLALGILRHLIGTASLDVDRIRHGCNDFETFSRQIDECTPQRVNEQCGIAPEVLVGLANQIGAARPATFRCGIGPQQSVNGDALVRSLSALSMLGSHEQHRGGGLFIAAMPALNESRAAGEQLGDTSRRSLDMTKLGQHLNDERLSPPIKGLMCWNTNPAVVLPDSRTLHRGLAREDLFTVVVEHFLTDTARYADIVLPSTTQLEHFDLLGAWGHFYVSVNHRAIKPMGESRSHGEIMRGLATHLGLKQDALKASDRDIALSVLPSHADTDTLLEQGWIKLAEPRVLPQAGTLSFASTARAHAVSDEFQLLTPKAHHFLNSSFANMPRHRDAEGEPRLEINPLDAAHLGFVQDDKVVVENARGHFRATLTVVPGMHRNVVAVAGKWWSENGVEGRVLNFLTPDSWSQSGQPAYNDTYVKIKRAPS